MRLLCDRLVLDYNSYLNSHFNCMQMSSKWTFFVPVFMLFHGVSFHCRIGIWNGADFSRCSIFRTLFSMRIVVGSYIWE